MQTRKHSFLVVGLSPYVKNKKPKILCKHNLELLKSLKEKGKTIIINSHILHDIEEVCDRGVIMKKGTVLDTWTKNESDESLEAKFIRLVGEEE